MFAMPWCGLALKRAQAKQGDGEASAASHHLHSAEEMYNNLSNSGPVLSGPETAEKAGNARLGWLSANQTRPVELVFRVRPIS